MYSIEEGIQHGLDKMGYQSLRDGQQEVIEAYLKGNDVFFCSPTGRARVYAMKLLRTFFISYYLGRILLELKIEWIMYVSWILHVSSPLISLMQDQVAIHIGADTTSY
jgi:hypothetical protein